MNIHSVLKTVLLQCWEAEGEERASIIVLGSNCNLICPAEEHSLVLTAHYFSDDVHPLCLKFQVKELIDIKSSNASIDFLRTLTLASMKIIECTLHTFPLLTNVGTQYHSTTGMRVQAVMAVATSLA